MEGRTSMCAFLAIFSPRSSANVSMMMPKTKFIRMTTTSTVMPYLRERIRVDHGRAVSSDREVGR